MTKTIYIIIDSLILYCVEDICLISLFIISWPYLHASWAGLVNIIQIVVGGSVEIAWL